MPPTGAKARSQSIHRRTVSKKSSYDSGIGSLTSSAAWSTRETYSTTPTLSAIGPVTNTLKSERSTVQSSFPRCEPQAIVPIELAHPPNAEHARGKVRRVESWLKEQERINNSMDDSSRERMAKAAGTPCNPYLAYPGLVKYTSWQDGDDQDDLLGSFVIVEEEESEEQNLGWTERVNTFERPADGFLSTSSISYASSPRPSSLRPHRPASILSVSSWRNLPFTKTSSNHRYPSAPGEPIDLSTPPASFRIGSSRRRSPIPENFLNSEVGRTAQNRTSCGTLKAPDTPRSTVRKRLGNLMRSYGNGESSSLSPVSAKSSSTPRPSTSASATTATTSTAVENERRSVSVAGGNPKRFLPKFNLNPTKTVRQPPQDIRLNSPTRSSFSSTLQHEEPDDPSPLPGQSFSHPEYPFTPTLSKRRSQPSIFRDRRHNASSSALSTLSIGSIGTIASNINGRASSVFSGSSTAKRKRLVVSGIAPDDSAAVEGLRKWCERFGELRQIIRMPNGDLIIDFKRADVADTVCRISARVHIADVGSVNVSWISGKRH